MATRAKKEVDQAIVIPKIKRPRGVLGIIGTEPLIMNCMSEKAKQGLLLPAPKKNAAARAETLKHNPIQEFRDSAYRIESGPTALGLPSTAFKGAMRNAALRVPGASKQLVGEMLYVPDQYVPIYGHPMVFMAITRNSDPGHTPDMRTRCIVSPWVAILPVIYTLPFLNEQSLANLAEMSGMVQGVGDGRTGKGWGNYGSFMTCTLPDKEVEAVMKSWGREQQLQALEDADPFDSETGKLLAWFHDELDRRGLKVPA